MKNPHAVLFDLDGTLLDTAPDFVTATNRLLTAKNRPELHPEHVRQLVSHGSVGIIEFAFDLPKEHPDFEPLRQELLGFYLQNLADKTRLFPGMEELLTMLGAKGIPWGIVTNKPELYTQAILEQLPISPAPATVICPDHVSNTKPDPESIYLACRKLGVEPRNSIYIGDHPRDIQAGLNAGSTTIAALYGYLADDDNPEDWGAHHQVNCATEIVNILF